MAKSALTTESPWMKEAMIFDITPEVVNLNETVEFSTWVGGSGTPVLLFVVDVNGAPFSFLLNRGFFDSEGRYQLGANVPDNPALQGLSLGILAIGADSTGDIVATNVEPLAIQ